MKHTFKPSQLQKEQWKRGRILDYWEYILNALPPEQSRMVQMMGFVVYKIRDPFNAKRDRFLIRVPGVSRELEKEIFQLQIYGDLVDKNVDLNTYAFSGEQVHLYNLADIIPYTPPTVLQPDELPKGVEIPGYPVDGPSVSRAKLLPEEAEQLQKLPA